MFFPTVFGVPRQRFALNLHSMESAQRLNFDSQPVESPRTYPAPFFTLACGAVVRRKSSPRFGVLLPGLVVLAALLLPMTAGAQTTYSGGAASFTTSDASPVSSTISVTGAPGSVATVEVQLLGVKSDSQEYTTGPYANQASFDSLGYAEFLLEGPGGAQLVLLYQTGSGIDGCDENQTPVPSCDGLQGSTTGSHPDTITILDGAHSAPNGAGSLGEQYEGWQTAYMPYTVAPSSYSNYDGDFPPPLPTAENTADYPQSDGSATLNGRFGGTQANGTWTLYLIDNDPYPGVDPFSITGWNLILTFSAATPTTTALSSSANPSSYPNSATSGSVTFTATVTSGSGTPTGSVTFQANGANISNCVGVAVSGGVAHCTVSLAQGNNSIAAQYTPSGNYGQSSSSITQLMEVTAENTTGDTWCNNSSVADPEGGNPGLAYPSVINIPSGTYSKSVANVTVELEGLQGTVNGVSGQFLLVAPGGGAQNLDFFDSGFAQNGPTSAANLTFEDSASGYVPYGTGTPGGGPYLPTDDNNQANPDYFPASTAPSIDSNIPQVPSIVNFALPYGQDNNDYKPYTNIYTFGEAFNGATANGDWALYSLVGEGANINSGWCIAFTFNSGNSTTTALTSGKNPATTGQPLTFTATVTSGGNPVTSGGTVTFLDNNAAPAGTVSGNNVVTLNGSGVATFTTHSLSEGDHAITANYSGVTNEDNESFSAVLHQRIDTATTATNVNSNTWQYCNPGAVQIQGATNAGPFTPNPSVITVTNLPGTLNTVGVQLTNFSVNSTYGLMELASLVEGPSGAALDFFSNTTQGANGNSTASAGNYVFEDNGANGEVSSGNVNLSPGDYKPTAYESYLDVGDTFTSSTSGFYPAPTAGNFSYAAPTTLGASSKFADIFTNGSDANGDWKLFFSSGFPNATFGAANGWCVNLTENLPTVSVDASHTGSFTQGQSGATLTVGIDNNGSTGPTGDPTGTNPMTVTDTLNSSFTYVGSSGTNWNCSAMSQTVTCTNDSAIAQGSAYPTLTIDVNVANDATGTLDNSVTASGAGVSSTTSNIDAITIAPPPNFSVSEGDTGTFTQGQTGGTLTVTVSNTAGAGSVTQGTTMVTETLPVGYSAASASFTTNGWSCSGTSTLTCTSTQQVDGGATFGVIDIPVSVPAAAPINTTTNAATASGGGALGSAISGTVTFFVVQTPASISLSGVGTQSTQISTPFAIPLAVTVTDAGGIPISGSSVTFTAPASAASGTFGNNSNTIAVSTNPSGIANAGTFTANGTAGGPYSVTVTDSPATPASFGLTNDESPSFTSANNATFLVSSPISFTVTTTGYPAVSLSISNVQNAIPGVNIPGSGTGTLLFSGSPTATGTETFTITASNGVGSPVVQNFTLTVQLPQYRLTTAANPAAGGTVTPASGNLYTQGTGVPLTAIANTGYTFVGWTSSPDAVVNPTSSSTTIPMNAAEIVTANFAPNLVVTTNKDDSGTATNCTAQATPGTGSDPSCSLRDALLNAGSAVAANISFDATAFAATNTAAENTIALSNGTLNIPANTSIDGATSGSGATLTNLVTVAGGGSSSNFSVLTVGSGVTGAAIANLTVSGGNVSGNGGGIDNSGALTVSNSTFSGNHAGGSGGGIYSSNGTLTVTGSTFSGNSVGSGSGGGIESAGTLTVDDSTFSRNFGVGSGGGIFIVSGTATVSNSTFSGNFVTLGDGGGIEADGNVTVSNNIFSGNSASTAGGGIFNAGGTLNASYNVYYNNTNGDCFNCTSNTNEVTADPKLAALGGYGGSTQTMIPLPGSSAICAISPSSASGADQRGELRTTTYGTVTCQDSGAVQTSYSIAFVQQPSTVVQNADLSPAPTVQLKESGVVFADGTDTTAIPLTLTIGSGILGGGSSSTSASTGIATYSALSISQPGTGDVLTANLSLNSASTPAAILAASNAFNVNSAVTQLAYSPSPAASLTAGGNAGTVTVNEEDSGGTPVTTASDTITLTVTGPGIYSNTYTATAISGVATFNLSSAALTAAGTYSYSAAISGNLSVTAATASETVSAAPVASVSVVGGTPQSAVIGAGFAAALKVLVEDQFGNPVPGAAVTFASPTSGASATFTGSPATTVKDGTASVTATANGTASATAYAVTASVSGAATPASLLLTNTQASTTLTVRPAPTTITYGQPVTITAAIAPASVLTSSPTGTVTFYDGSTGLTPVSMVAGASASYTVSVPAVGSHTYAAQYGGDNNFSESPQSSAASALTVSKAGTTLSGPSSPVNLTYGTGGSITISVAGQFSGAGIATPSGNVSYTIGSGAAQSATINSGAATLTVPANQTAGSYTVTVSYLGDGNYNAATSIAVGLSISKATATVTLGGLTQTYTGSALAATATTSPASLTVNFTYNGSANAPTAAGTYAVVGTISDANYQGSATGTLTIAKAAATVTLGSLTQTYTGSALAVTATTAPANLTVNFTYNGLSAAPTAAGTYAVIGTIDDPNYQGTATGTLTIAKAAATVTLGSLTQTYTGSALAVTATTAPANLTVNFTYNGLSAAPTAAGTYAVIGTIDDPNYQGTATGTLTIAKAAATVTLGSLTQTYTGSALAVTATTAPANLTVNFTYNGLSAAPTAAGTYAVIGTIDDPNYQGTATGTLTIAKAAATVTLGSLTQTYTGSARAATATTSPANLTVNLTYNGLSAAPTAAGIYTVIGTIGDANYQGSATGTMTINQATSTVTWTTPAAITYGTALTATQLDASSPVAGTFAYSPAAGTILAAGSQLLSVTFTPTDANDYTSATASVSLTVNDAPQSITFGAGTLAYAAGVPFGTAPLTLTANGGASGNPVVFTLVSGPATIGGNILTVTGAGMIQLMANQAGNADYTAAAPVSESITVLQAFPLVSLTASTSTTFVQNAVTLTATVSSAAGVPTGSVTFLDGTTPLGTTALVNGSATLTTATLAVGTHSITVDYTGDTNFLSAASSALPELVEDFTLSIDTNVNGVNQTLTPGSTAEFTFVVAPPAGGAFAQDVAFSLSGLPAGATYSFSPSVLKAGTGATTVTLTIQLPQTNAMIQSEKGMSRGMTPLALGLLLLPFAGRLRRASRRLHRGLMLLLLIGVSLAGALGLTGCASGGGFFGQQQKTYTVTVTGSSGALSHSATITLTVE